MALPDAKGLPYNQRGPFSAGFLPAVHQGTVIKAGAANPVPDLFANGRFKFANREADREGLALLRRMNERHAAERPDDSRLESRIRSYELAAKMQLSAPEAFDLGKESAATRQAYGLDDKVTGDFGRRCLLARRLCECGTRFVQVWSGDTGSIAVHSGRIVSCFPEQGNDASAFPRIVMSPKRLLVPMPVRFA